MMSRVATVFALLITLSTAAHAQSVREVSYGQKSVAAISAKLRFTTLIVLPEGEEILDFVCGDKDFWVVSGAQNFAYVKPGKAAAATNLNLVTASGRVYSFLLTEGGSDPDLKVYVHWDEASTPTSGAPQLHSTAEVQALRQTIEETKRQLQEARGAAAASVEEAAHARLAAERTSEEQISAFRAAYPTQLQFSYRYKASDTLFRVSAIFHDDRFTYIRANPIELPALYELVDGAPNLLTFQVLDGTYIVPKVLDRGYLVIGKQKFSFQTAR